MVHYIIQTVAFQLFFLIIYDVFLKNETFFNWNRIYLLATSLVSILMPFIKIDGFKNVMPQEYIISLPEIVIGTPAPNTIQPIQLDAVVISNEVYYWETAFFIGLTISVLVFLYKLIRILILIFKNPKTYNGTLTLIQLLNSNAAFSFFRYVFLGELLKNEDKEAVLKHEIIHVKQLHSIDLIYFEMLRMVFWFNPLLYMYQNRITALHEFIADAEAIKNESKSQYYQNLLSQVFETKNISFINTFFNQSLIKKRIIMLQKSKSKQVKLLKYALLIPVVLGMLVYVSCEKEDKINQVDELKSLEFSYSLKSGHEMPDEAKIAYEKYEAFLKANPEYVSWALFDEETKTAYYSLHSISEEVPSTYIERPKRINSPEGESNKSYVYFKSVPAVEGIYKNTVEVEVPFSVIEQVPVFPGCEGMSNDEQKKCMSENITKHVGKNFNTEIAVNLGLQDKSQRINVIFKINQEGNIIDVESRAAHPALEAEAIRVVKMLPKMEPGKQKGENVTVPYSLPIVFQVRE